MSTGGRNGAGGWEMIGSIAHDMNKQNCTTRGSLKPPCGAAQCFLHAACLSALISPEPINYPIWAIVFMFC